ncbi:transcriptional regulator [Salimicrobium jeotgali]|uniref:Helix-turn-helix domain protein n=1 Tax=Salimicrobium jeotgali TaxID=1230341 RepID=K2HAV5_9BACI|nr:helix-turn-helix transcriptional regulator [Salimicrobium jeotgali]AKG04469.1 transcriptional regulator [Salimicrobium jeotgali]EKE32675.1 helix-turn-helix domain protein [Salimicrobium jeotgali]MBM7695339.1 transcriptional regulator with XRE-family HTH domain [Salimicrobium jeotgali]
MKDLTRTDDIFKELPETEEFFHGIGAILGRAVFAARMEASLTQEELAEKAGVDLKTVTRAEGGSGVLEVRMFDKLFRALGISSREYAALFVEAQ